ncbi:glycosyltransferase family 2 protein [Butyrivibrio hungatei]|uniref:glycosyltransferase family 2 protein n=1 Tax=Butyrivibrio hungatei TaxID=185008 RepID=UPI000429B4E1|nr:glycosyltransferase family 2 protein [Butyrivibrio hungatei]
MLSVIVVDYNSIEKTLKYIRDISKKLIVDGDIHYIIVDNHSDVENLCENHKYSHCFSGKEKLTHKKSDEFEGKRVSRYSFGGKSLTYISAGENLGYAKGNNLGMRLSEKLFGDEYYLVSNNDIEISDTFDFGRIKGIFDRNTAIAVIGPKIVGLDGEVQSPNRKPTAFGNLVMTYLSMATHDKIFKWNDVDYTDESKICYRVMGSFMLIRASAMSEVGMFDEKTFMFAEEMILSERLLRCGYLTYFYNGLSVIHAHGESVDKLEDRSEPVRWAHESLSYYFKEYRKTSEIIIRFGRVVCGLYIKLYKLKKKIASR